MKLSQAIILGDTLKKCDPDTWLSPDGSCGCAFGGALLAAGIKAEVFDAGYMKNPAIENPSESPIVQSLWPWLDECHLDHISILYYGVSYGHNTIEDVAAYVREIEPEETNVEDSHSPVVADSVGDSGSLLRQSVGQEA